ncbi:hypothetical protein QBC40DRAFT_284099 [Triangularia verruculosa]|uniref:FAR1 domain-containing protein n=1 Tax=Triangularia verruculosa TaxID=2587418 RepID=A0AAN6XCX5_9PEZI|nr:hypothetical protein QBC40DRAFT_284099 [Triangularia verruculosa]
MTHQSNPHAQGQYMQQHFTVQPQIQQQNHMHQQQQLHHPLQQVHQSLQQAPQPSQLQTQPQSQPQSQHQNPPRPNFQMALLPPPQDRLYPTFQVLLEDVKSFTRSQGYAVVIVSSLNRDSEGNYRRYNLCCAKGGKTYASHSKGIRNTRSTKTGCPMRLKAVQEKAHPYNDKWHVVVQCAEHNHEPFTGEPGANVPAQFRKIEPDGARWLMIMHREAQLTLRQLTIGIRISFGDKYQYVKKSDVRNMLAKMKREEERKAAQEAAAQGLPSNVPYTLIPQQHQPPPPAPVNVQQMPALPEGIQVPDPDLESDDDGVEEL